MKKIIIIFALLITGLVASPLSGEKNVKNEFALENISQDITVNDEGVEEQLKDEQKIVIDQDNRQESVIENVEQCLKIESSNNKKIDNSNKCYNVQNNTNYSNNDNMNNYSENLSIQSPKEETKVNTQVQEQIYCIDGGSCHISGDDVNEHGYYDSWDSAYQAFKEYTKDWDSCQFKVNACACGKYYFWAIK